MGYISERGRELDALLEKHGIDGAARDEVVTYVKRITLESYRNGQRAGAPQDAKAAKPAKKGGQITSH